MINKLPSLSAVTDDEGPMKQFPIMDEPQVHSIPWAVIARHERQAEANHDQSLEVLARRGGLSCCEAVAVLEDRPWERMNHDIARSRLIQIVTSLPIKAVQSPLPDDEGIAKEKTKP